MTKKIYNFIVDGIDNDLRPDNVRVVCYYLMTSPKDTPVIDIIFDVEGVSRVFSFSIVEEKNINFNWYGSSYKNKGHYFHIFYLQFLSNFSKIVVNEKLKKDFIQLVKQEI